MEVYDEAHALARALMRCQEFKAYLAAREKVLADPNKREMVLNFRRQQAEVEVARLAGQEVGKEKEEQLARLYELLRLNPTVAEFLESESRLARLVADVQKIIGDALRPFLEPLAGEERQAGSEQNS